MIELICVPMEGKENVVQLPDIAFPSDAGVDLFSAEKVEIFPNTTVTISTGLRVISRFKKEWTDIISIPFHEPQTVEDLTKKFIMENFKLAMIIKGRSGLAQKKNLNPLAGVIDETYVGEVKIILANQSKKTQTINIGDKIAQGLVTIMPKISQIKWGTEEDIPVTKRGTNGFGSTDR